MFRRKKDEKSEYEKKIDGLEEMCWLHIKEMVRIEDVYSANANVMKWQSGKDKTNISNIQKEKIQKEKIQLVIFSLVEDLIHDEILNREYVGRKYGDVFAMSKTISNRIIKALGGEKDE